MTERWILFDIDLNIVGSGSKACMWSEVVTAARRGRKLFAMRDPR